MVPLYTFYLSPDDFGYYDLIISTVSVILPIITIQIYDAMYRFMLDKEDINEKKDIVRISMRCLLFSLIILNCFAFILSLISDIQYLFLIVLYLNLSIINNFYDQILRGFKLNKLFASINIFKSLILLTLNVVFITKFKLGVAGLLVSSIISMSIGIVILESKVKMIKLIKYRKKNSKQTLLEMIKYSLPLIPNSINWWIVSLSDRYIINMVLGVAANGVYAIANKFSTIIVFINDIFYMAWKESAIDESREADKGKNLFEEVFDVYSTLQFTTILIIIPMLKILVPKVISSEYHNAVNLIPILILAAVFQSMSGFFGASYLSSKDTKNLFYSSLISALINIFINLILINKIGLLAASLSTLISYFILFMYRLVQCKRYLNIKLRVKKMALLNILVIIYICIYYINSIAVQAFIIVVGIILFIHFNKEFISKAMIFTRSIIKKKIKCKKE